MDDVRANLNQYVAVLILSLWIAEPQQHVAPENASVHQIAVMVYGVLLAREEAWLS